MSLLNLVLAAVGVTLVLMARGTWTGWWTPDTAYGVASGALGFGALAAPSLARCGSTAWSRSRAGVLLLGAALAVVAVSPTVLWALLPLVLAGAAAVHAESAATGVVQQEADDEVRASLFGVADACMVGAAMLGALAAPALAAAAGPPVLRGRPRPAGRRHDRGHRAAAGDAGRGRSAATDHDGAADLVVGLHGRPPARPPRRARRSAPPDRGRSRPAAGRPGASQAGASATTRRCTSSPSGPPSRATRCSWSRASRGIVAIRSWGT